MLNAHLSVGIKIMLSSWDEIDVLFILLPTGSVPSRTIMRGRIVPIVSRTEDGESETDLKGLQF